MFCYNIMTDLSLNDVNLVKFRYTFAAAMLPSAIDGVLKTLVPIFRVHDTITMGYETLDRASRPTHPHLHVHFNTIDSIKNIRARFRTWLKNNSDDRINGAKGAENKVYSLTTPEDGVKNNMRFYRYPWKQGGRCGIEFEKLASFDYIEDDADIELEIERARAEYAALSDVRAKAIAKHEDKVANSTYSKISKRCDDLMISSPKIVQLDDVMDTVIDVYVEHELSMNTSTMAGYALTYAVSKKIVSKEAVRTAMKKHLNY